MKSDGFVCGAFAGLITGMLLVGLLYKTEEPIEQLTEVAESIANQSSSMKDNMLAVVLYTAIGAYERDEMLELASLTVGCASHRVRMPELSIHSGAYPPEDSVESYIEDVQVYDEHEPAVNLNNLEAEGKK